MNSLSWEMSMIVNRANSACINVNGMFLVSRKTRQLIVKNHTMCKIRIVKSIKTIDPNCVQMTRRREDGEWETEKERHNP